MKMDLIFFFKQKAYEKYNKSFKGEPKKFFILSDKLS